MSSTATSSLENILLTRDGLTLVADFGIARALDAEDHLTRTGITIGSPLYMSPEQTDGGEIDPGADQYALASVLFEMLSGEPPSPARPSMRSSPSGSPTRHRASTTLNPEVPAAVDDAIQRALAPEPNDRFVTIAEFARRCTGRRGHSRRELDASPSRMVRPGAVQCPESSLALLLGILIGGGALFAWRRIAGRAERTKVIAVLPFENLGDSADAYFADGVADEVRTKLAQVGELEVIARGSSIEYEHSTSGPTEIAQELGADYLLTGTVRWEKGAGTNRVRVTPELVEARPRQGGPHPLGSAVRRLAHRRLPGPGRHRDQGGRTRWASSWATAPDASSWPSRPRTLPRTTSS